jgi:hypothetical protein
LGPLGEVRAGSGNVAERGHGPAQRVCTPGWTPWQPRAAAPQAGARPDPPTAPLTGWVRCQCLPWLARTALLQAIRIRSRRGPRCASLACRAFSRRRFRETQRSAHLGVSSLPRRTPTWSGVLPRRQRRRRLRLLRLLFGGVLAANAKYGENSSRRVATHASSCRRRRSAPQTRAPFSLPTSLCHS